jgi:hypothetical protein
VQLRYFVPFKAQEGVNAEFALKEKLLNIEGVAIDTSVNANKWQIPEEDLDFFVQSLLGVQLRVDHAESALMVVGKVPEAKRLGNQVLFRAEVGDLPIIEKILRNYVNHVSAQVDSEDVECSKCKKQTRKEGILIHLCPGAWEIVHKPKVRELSIVASPAYQTTEFKPVGFAAAMNESQGRIQLCEGMTPAGAACDIGVVACAQNGSLTCRKRFWSSKNDKDVGSKRELQEPENKTESEAKEVKPLSDSQTGQAKASPHQAQGVVNVGDGETAPKQVTYEEYMNQLTQLEQKIKQTPEASEAEVAALTKKISELEAEVAKRAKKGTLSKKISELSKKISELAEEGEEAEEAEEAQETGVKMVQQESKRASGQGIVAVDEVQRDALGNVDWFKDLLKAHSKLVGLK